VKLAYQSAMENTNSIWLEIHIAVSVTQHAAFNGLGFARQPRQQGV
jgi:hypothetical protein